MLHGVYNGALAGIRAVFPIYALGARLGGVNPAELRQRQGWIDPLGARGPVWIQAASVGEVGVASVLVGALRARIPGLAAFVTTTTRTGQAQARRTFKDAGAGFSYFPLDFPAAVRRFLATVGPRALILTETEIWPNLLREASRSRLPVLIVNGRISDRGFRRYLRIRPLIAEGLDHVSVACVQTDLDRQRFARLGLPDARIRVTGNIKFGAPAEALGRDGILRALRLDPTDELWVGGSTAEGEERALIDAFRALPPGRQGARRVLVLAPRRPERFDEVAALLAREGRPWSRRSAPGGETAKPEMILLDSLGELPALYGAASVAFVGGTLAPIGGHNLVEPAARGVAPVFGPNVQNVREAAASLLAAGGGFQVEDTARLAALFSRLSAEPTLRREAGERARRIVLENARSVDATVLELLPWLGEDSGAS